VNIAAGGMKAAMRSQEGPVVSTRTIGPPKIISVCYDRSCSTRLLVALALRSLYNITYDATGTPLMDSDEIPTAQRPTHARSESLKALDAARRHHASMNEANGYDIFVVRFVANRQPWAGKPRRRNAKRAASDSSV
jgi:hypothetical protein